MKNYAKKLLTIGIIMILLFTSLLWVPQQVIASSNTHREILRSGKKTKRLLRRGNRDNINALYALMKTREWNAGAENLAPIDGTPTTREELMKYLKQLYLQDIKYIILSGDMLNEFMESSTWGYDGIWSNYMPEYIFNPGIVSSYHDTYIIEDSNGNATNKKINWQALILELDDEEIAAVKRCREIAHEIEYLYPNTTVVQKAQIISEYLRGIAVYNKKNYDMYDLLFEGECNCQAYSDTFDTIMKYLGIPCEVVDSQKYNHAWNIFYEYDNLDLKIYKIDVTNNWGPVLLEADSKIYDMDYPEIKIAQLNLEKELLETDDTGVYFANFEARAIYKDDDETSPTYGTTYYDKEGTIVIPSMPPEKSVPTLVPIASIVVSPAAIDVRYTTPSPTPTLAPIITEPITPTPTPAPLPKEEDVVVVQQPTQAPGTVTIVDDEEANRKITYEDIPAKIDITGFDIWRTLVKFTVIKAEGEYELRYRHPNGDWKTIFSHKNVIEIRGLKPGTTIYVQVRNVKFANGGWNNKGEWSKSYKVTTEE